MRYEIPPLSGGLDVIFVNDSGGRVRVYIDLNQVEQIADPQAYAIVYHGSPERIAAATGPAFFRLFREQIHSVSQGVTAELPLGGSDQFELIADFVMGRVQLTQEEIDVKLGCYLQASFTNIFASASTPVSIRILCEDTGLDRVAVNGYLLQHQDYYRLSDDSDFVWRAGHAR